MPAVPAVLPQEMDVEAEMARGLLPGSIALSSKFVPAIKKVRGHGWLGRSNCML